MFYNRSNPPKSYRITISPNGFRGKPLVSRKYFPNKTVQFKKACSEFCLQNGLILRRAGFVNLYRGYTGSAIDKAGNLWDIEMSDIEWMD